VVEERIKSIIAELCSISKEKISSKTPFSELGIDSLDSVELMLILEKEFNIEIPHMEFEFNNINDVVNFVEGKVGQQIRASLSMRE